MNRVYLYGLYVLAIGMVLIACQKLVNACRRQKKEAIIRQCRWEEQWEEWEQAQNLEG